MASAQQKVTAYVNAARAVAETIREVGKVPSGQLWAILMPVMTFAVYEAMVNMLISAKLISRKGHVLEWCGPDEWRGERNISADE